MNETTQNLEQLCESLGVTLKHKNLGMHNDDTFGKAWRHTKWSVTVSHNGKSYKTEYHTGEALKAAPTVADVVAALVLDADCGAQSFDDYCDNFGADKDSRQAHNTWMACRRTDKRMRELFTAEELTALAEAASEY